jgi:hypothetical protein
MVWTVFYFCIYLWYSKLSTDGVVHIKPFQVIRCSIWSDFAPIANVNPSKEPRRFLQTSLPLTPLKKSKKRFKKIGRGLSTTAIALPVRLRFKYHHSRYEPLFVFVHIQR